jgi:hypothetical protein
MRKVPVNSILPIDGMMFAAMNLLRANRASKEKTPWR